MSVELTAEMVTDGLVPSNPRLAPDGRHVAYAVAPVGQREERRRSAIWLVATAGASPPRQYLPLAGGEAEALTDAG